MEKLKRLNYLKLAKYVVGAVFAIELGILLDLEYAYAAGIITLLTILDTKKETIIIAMKRLVIFMIMTILSICVFTNMGYGLAAFGVVLIPYLFACLLLDMKEAVAPIAVLCTHYISAESCSAAMIMNEFQILILGAGTGVALNLFMPDGERQIRKRQQAIDAGMRRILERMAVFIEKNHREGYDGTCFTALEEMLKELHREALHYMNNHFTGDNDYYYAYVQMRMSQSALLKRMYKDIMRINMVPKQAKPIADFFRQTSSEFHEINDAVGLMVRLEEMEEQYRNEKLPEGRAEFENRAILYHIMKDLEEFIEIKHDFSLRLTDKQKKKYWGMSG